MSCSCCACCGDSETAFGEDGGIIKGITNKAFVLDMDPSKFETSDLISVPLEDKLNRQFRPSEMQGVSSSALPVSNNGTSSSFTARDSWGLSAVVNKAEALAAQVSNKIHLSQPNPQVRCTNPECPSNAGPLVDTRL